MPEEFVCLFGKCEDQSTNDCGFDVGSMMSIWWIRISNSREVHWEPQERKYPPTGAPMRPVAINLVRTSIFTYVLSRADGVVSSGVGSVLHVFNNENATPIYIAHRLGKLHAAIMRSQWHRYD